MTSPGAPPQRWLHLHSWTGISGGTQPACSSLAVPNAWRAQGNTLSLEAQEGDTLSLSCEAKSHPEATVSWTKGNESLNPRQGRAGRLELGNLGPGDAGEYQCLARNLHGSASRALRMHLQTLQATPQISSSRTSSSSPPVSQDRPHPGTSQNSSCQRKGPSLSCSCSLRSRPPPRLQWQVDGEPLEGNSSWGALRIRSWAQGDEAVSTLNWTGTGEWGSQIFCLGANPHGLYVLHLEVSPLQRDAGGSGKLLGAGVACGVGVALGFFLLGLWVIRIRRRGRGPEPPSAETGQMANGSQGQHTADIPGLIYCNVTPLPVDHKLPAARQSRGVQGVPLSPGEPEELHYAAIDLTKLQHPEGEPPPAPESEYSEIRRK